MHDHAIPYTGNDESIEDYLPMAEQQIIWGAVEEEDDLPLQQESYASYEAVDALVDNHFPDDPANVNSYLPLVETDQQPSQSLVEVFNDCAHAIDDLCVYSNELKEKIEELENLMAEVEKNFNVGPGEENGDTQPPPTV